MLCFWKLNHLLISVCVHLHWKYWCELLGGNLFSFLVHFTRIVIMQDCVSPFYIVLYLPISIYCYNGKLEIGSYTKCVVFIVASFHKWKLNSFMLYLMRRMTDNYAPYKRPNAQLYSMYFIKLYRFIEYNVTVGF